MSSVATSNWLAIAGALYALAGMGFVAKAALTNAGFDASPQERQSAQARRELNIWFGLPVLAAGFFMQAMGGMGAVPFSGVFACLMLLLAFGMLLFVALEDTILDLFGDRVVTAARSKPNIALLPSPVQESRTIEAVSVRIVETALP